MDGYVALAARSLLCDPDVDPCRCRCRASMAPRQEYERRIERWDGVVRDGERTHLRISNLRLAPPAPRRSSRGWPSAASWCRRPGSSRRVWRSWCWSSSMPACSSATSADAARDVSTSAGWSASTGRGRGADRMARDFSAAIPTRAISISSAPPRCSSCSTPRARKPAKRRLPPGSDRPAAIDEIQARQPAVAELAARRRFPRDARGARGRGARRPHERADRWAGLAPAGASLGALAGFAACGGHHGCAAGGGSLRRLPEQALFAWLVVQVGIVLRARRWVNQITSRVEAASADLGLFRQLDRDRRARTFAVAASARDPSSRSRPTADGRRRTSPASSGSSRSWSSANTTPTRG